MKRLGALAAVSATVAALSVWGGACGSSNSASPASDGDAFDRAPRDAGVARSDSATTPAEDAALASDAPVSTALPDGDWEPVTSAAPCRLSAARMPPDPFPPRTWASCGPGCRVADAWPGQPTTSALVVGSGGACTHGESYVYLGSDGQPETVAVSRMSDGATVAAVRIDATDGACVFSGFGGDAPFLFSVFEEDAGLFFGRASAEAGAPVAWQSGWVANGPAAFVSRFMFDEGHGVVSSTGQVAWLPSSAAGAFTTLESSLSPVDYASGRGHLLVWNRNDGQHGWITSFVADGGAPAVLFAAPTGTLINVARATDDRVVWLSVTGPQASQFVYAGARIDWVTYTATPGGLVTQSQPPGPVLSATTGLYDLAAGDDYAATIGCDANPDPAAQICRVYVARLSTGKVWAVPQRPGGNSFRRVLAIGASEVVLAEQDARPAAIQSAFKRIVRIAIDQLDAVVAAW
jgi:hypothetical protein